ncbi:MAG: GNAT family N-acetyltransferase [Alphaproteobacteria bacterium]|nr:GNAT family N-acetyltransferase [Alphaproteobacteria bacterium]
MIEKKPFTEIQTDRLILKPHKATIEYATKLYNVIAENKEFLSRFMPLLYKVSRVEDEYNFCLSASKAFEEMTSADYGIWTKDNQLIGTCTFTDIDYEERSGEIGYFLSQDQTKKGYMTEAINALMDTFFERGFNRIVIYMDTQNKPSENVAIRCGLTKEGQLRQWRFNPVFNEFRNIFVYSKLKSEWKKEK